MEFGLNSTGSPIVKKSIRINEDNLKMDYFVNGHLLENHMLPTTFKKALELTEYIRIFNEMALTTCRGLPMADYQSKESANRHVIRKKKVKYDSHALFGRANKCTIVLAEKPLRLGNRCSHCTELFVSLMEKRKTELLKEAAKESARKGRSRMARQNLSRKVDRRDTVISVYKIK